MSINIVEQIESGEITWDNVYSQVLDQSFKPLLQEFSNLKDTNQGALKVNINSEFGALDNEYFSANNRNISGSITFIGRLLNRLTGDNINRYLQKKFNGGEYIIYQDTDSGYIHFDKVVEKLIKENFNTDYDLLSNDDKHKAIDFMLEFIDNEIQPIIDDTVDFVRKKFNSFKKGFMGAKVEKIAKRGFWTAKKRYALLAIYDEGSYKIEKEKIAVTGIETVKSQTPDFAIEILEEALRLILKETEEEFQTYLKSQKAIFLKRVMENPQAVCEVVKINNLIYDHDERGYFRINDTGRRIGAPANSKGGIAYNKLLNDLQLNQYYQEIEEGMKCYIAKLKVPNAIESDVIAFLDEAFLFDADIVKSIDGNYLWEKHIISPLKTIVESIDYSLVKQVSNLDDW